MSAETKTLGLKLRKERKAQGLTVDAMARALRDTAPEHERHDLPKLADLQRKIRDWEAGKWAPSERYRLLYCRALGLTEDALFGAFLQARAEVKHARTGPKQTAAEPATREEADDVERRQLLQALAALGIATVSPVTDALGTIQSYVEKGLDRGIAAKIDDWDETVAEYGYSYLSTPPDQLIGELAADLVSVQALKPYLPIDGAQRSRWFRVTAGLSWLMAKTLANVGHTRPSRTWWTTAQNAADSSGDHDLSMWIAGERLIRGLYEQRPAPLLLRQAAAVAESSGGRTNAGLLKVHTMRTQLYAAIGRSGDALAELRRAEDVFTQLPASATSDIASDWCWGEDRIRYVTTWVYAHLGQRDALEVAADQAARLLEAAGRPRAVTQIRLLQATGYVRSGDVAAGVTHAASTYGRCAPDQRTAIVTELAGGVWHAIPHDRRQEPAAEAYREMLAPAGPPRRSIT